MGELTALLDIFNRDVISERWRQLKKWGAQSHPDGTGRPHALFDAHYFRQKCDLAAAAGTVTWADIALEEFYEALAETEYKPLRAELIQLATVALAWVEDLDNRAGVPAIPVFPPQIAANAERLVPA